MISRPTMFIGSSSEGKLAAEYLQASLVGHCDAKVWDQHLFTPTGETLGELIRVADTYDYAALVLTPDDQVNKRGGSQLAPRDNVILELGLFIGALGRERVFLVAEAGTDLQLPSDILGVTLVTFTPHSPRDPRAEINPVALQMREVIGRLGRRKLTVAGAGGEDPWRFVIDLAEGFIDGAAGVRVSPHDPDAQREWQGNLLGMLVQIYAARSEGSAYTLWLAPRGESDGLDVAMSRNLPDDYEHYPYRPREGLAGKVWSAGVPAAHSTDKPHEWWAFREGCESHTYIAAPVAPVGGSGGVLAVGSHQKFPIRDDDVHLIQAFATLLAVTAVSTPESARKDLLRARAELADSSLAQYAASRPAHSREVRLLKAIVAEAREVMPNDAVVSTVEPLGEDEYVEVGVLRMALAQVGAALRFSEG